MHDRFTVNRLIRYSGSYSEVKKKKKRGYVTTRYEMRTVTVYVREENGMTNADDNEIPERDGRIVLLRMAENFMLRSAERSFPLKKKRKKNGKLSTTSRRIVLFFYR